ncbi:5'-methylthioadenosine/S-adenosylhomocysteine nucleosidase [Dermabacteraceae bacterium P13136]
MIAILTAMPEEAAPFLSALTDPQPLTDSPLPAVTGKLSGRATCVVTTGIGTARASLAATWAALTLRPDAIISAGSCGGLGKEVQVGDVVIGETYAYSVADATAFGYAPGQVPGAPARFASPAELVRAAKTAQSGDTPAHAGLMLSGDSFVTAPLAGRVRETFPGALSADMESTAIMHVAHSLNIPAIAVRAVSDLCDPDAGQRFHIGLEEAAKNSFEAVTSLVDSAF